MASPDLTKTGAHPGPEHDRSPWPALWAMVIGFFMILVDSTIVSVATPAIREDLNTDYNTVIWVTSAYLLAYAVPLLITGRLGDRIGPKKAYLTGLALFTAASLACGLTHTAGGLITARVVQGLGAALLTPQTMAVITRTFPPQERGKAMALWGATAGVAMLVGPIAGGILVDAAGWEWIFFVNVPVGIVGFFLAMRMVPELQTHNHAFDWLGVALSAIAMFLLVFGIQEGERYSWGTITGIISVPLLIALGVVVFAGFVLWQAKNTREPLVPLSLFRDRNFSVANLGVSTLGFAFTGFAVPFMVWAQTARGWSPTQAGCLLIPMAVVSVVAAPVVGRLADQWHPRVLTSIGFGLSAVSMFAMAFTLGGDTAVWKILVIVFFIGLGSSFLWGPLAVSANRNLPPQLAGAGSGIYNTTRQIGGVLGSAAISASMTSRLQAHLGGNVSTDKLQQSGGALPSFLVDKFATAMGEAIVVPAAAFVVGLVVVQFFVLPHFMRRKPTAETAEPEQAPTHSQPAT